MAQILISDQHSYLLYLEIHDRLIDEYFELRDEKESTLGIQQLSPELQMFSKMFEAVAKQELEQKRQAEHIREVAGKTHE